MTLYDDAGDRPTVALTYAASTPAKPVSNLGDALSAVLVSALSGLPCRLRGFDSATTRMAAVGTIGQNFKNGCIHFWGTGVDGTRNPVDRSVEHYIRPADTEFCVHALRGPFSRDTFVSAGIHCPEIYGDPVYFVPSLVPACDPPRYELGVIVHISELDGYDLTSAPLQQYKRYFVSDDDAGSVRIIHTLCTPSYQALFDKIGEIAACRRILSTSLHGLVLAEAYRIPCLYFGIKGSGFTFEDLTQLRRVDQRIRDFYAGVGLRRIPCFHQPRDMESDWSFIMKCIDSSWTPLSWNADDFLSTFPLPLKFNPLQQEPFTDFSILSENRY